MKHIQHGDISLHQTKEIPKTAKEVKFKDNFVLAHGEATGHQHRLVGDCKIFKDNDTFFVLSGLKTQLEHYNSLTGQKAEHETKTLIPQTTYIVRQERSFNPFLEEVNKVRD